LTQREVPEEALSLTVTGDTGRRGEERDKNEIKILDICRMNIIEIRRETNLNYLT